MAERGNLRLEWDEREEALGMMQHQWMVIIGILFFLFKTNYITLKESLCEGGREIERESAGEHEKGSGIGLHIIFLLFPRFIFLFLPFFFLVLNRIRPKLDHKGITLTRRWSVYGRSEGAAAGFSSKS